METIKVSEVIEVKRHRTNEKIKVIGEHDIKKVTLHKFYDLDGSRINEGTQVWNNVHVKIQEHTWKEFGSKWKLLEVFINGKEIEEEIVSLKGNTQHLVLHGCTGAG